MYRRAQDVGFALGIAALYAATAWLGGGSSCCARAARCSPDRFACVIATINHELRTPLTAMLGSIGFAASGKFGKPEPQLARRRARRSRRERERRPLPHQRDRSWVRHSLRVPQGAVREILAGRHVGRTQPRRHRPGNGDSQAPDRADVGPYRLRVGRERGNDLPPVVSARELRGGRGLIARQRLRS